jgi:hypothetical protein
MIEHIKTCREAIKSSRAMQSALRAEIRRETQINRVVKADQRAAAKAARILARNQRAHERIAKLEARIEAMRLKANSPKQVRKSQRAAGPVKVWSTEEIAALNA